MADDARELAIIISVALRVVSKPDLKAMATGRGDLRETAIEEFAQATAQKILGRFEITAKPWTELGKK